MNDEERRLKMILLRGRGGTTGTWYLVPCTNYYYYHNVKDDFIIFLLLGLRRLGNNMNIKSVA